jgi:prepilin-type N-terminal cleavage/methylation domain-containing protein
VLRGLRGVWDEERGFTLPEILVTVILMGILFGIATSTWFGVVESRRVDSATNQLAADLRLAHTQATNRLANHSIVVAAANSSTYEIGPTGGTLATRTLPDVTQIAAATTIVFRSNGDAVVTSGAGSPITVRSSNDTTNDHTIEFNTTTSRIKIVP